MSSWFRANGSRSWPRRGLIQPKPRVPVITALVELPTRWLRDTVVTTTDPRHGYLLSDPDAEEDRLWRQAWEEVTAALG